MSNTFKELLKEAKKLGIRVNTVWSKEHEDLYNDFADKIEEAYFDNRITAAEHDYLACIAFYDYQNLYCDPDDPAFLEFAEDKYEEGDEDEKLPNRSV